MNFVIIASARTGSSHLAEKLRGHPDILCHGEVFHPKNVWVFWPKRDLTDDVKAELLEQKRTNPEALLERVFAAKYGATFVGFKIFNGHCDEILDKLIRDRSVRKVVLYRRNVLANYSSAVAANRSKTWSIKSTDSQEVSEKVPFRPGRFVQFHNDYVGFYRQVIRKLTKSGQTFFNVDYEDINEPHLFTNLINFLGADPKVASESPGKKQLVKQNPRDILSRFSNPDEVMPFLREHRLLHWLHEGETSFAALSRSEQVKAELALSDSVT